MRFCIWMLAIVLVAGTQSDDTEFRVYTEHPRLLLKPQRLRLLRRERERKSPRWIQFEMLIRGKARMPESAFALALYAAITEDPQAAKEAVAAARAPGASIREIALALDWADPESAALRERLRGSLSSPVTGFASARDRAFAALALGEARPLEQLVRTWWARETAPRLESGELRLSHADLYPFVEFLHAIRDNYQIDLRDDIPRLFRDIALEQVLAYYPPTWPAAENDYRIPWFAGKGDPNLEVSALKRAAEMALVAYENNAQEMQFLQGWVQNDRFVLRGPFGAPYEFLWANPYQPGLPFEKLPLLHHNERAGSLVVRSSWEESATWLGYFGAKNALLFRDGAVEPLRLKQPLTLGEVVVVQGSPEGAQLEIKEQSPAQWFILGLKPNTVYDIETDDEGMVDARTDRGGILELSFRRTDGQTVLIHEPRR